jgi:alkylation response protein AidB-like acyl-CoA dehydrogenase
MDPDLEGGHVSEVAGAGSPGPQRRRFSRLGRLRARIAHVEAVFGAPWAVTNPSGLAAAVQAANRDQLAPMAVQRYFYARLQDELVAIEFGGRFEALDELALVHRAVFRRDPGLGYALGFVPFVANIVVALNGTGIQRASTAETILHRGLLGTAFPRYDNGVPAQASELQLRRSGEGYELTGVKYDIPNAHVAEKIVVFARTGSQPAAYSTALVDPAAAAALSVRLHEAVPNLGVQGTEVAGLEFTHHQLPPDALIGEWDRGLANGIRTLPAIHALLPALLIGLADTGLRQAVEALENEPAGDPSTVAVVTALAGAFADLMCADALSLVATRIVHLAPGDSQVLSAASRYLVPSMLRELLGDAVPSIGDTFHERNGAESVLAKHLRDLDAMAYTSVGLSNALNIIAPFLPLFGSSRFDEVQPCPPELFRIDVEVPALSREELTGYGGADGLVQYLTRLGPMLSLTLATQEDGEAVIELVDLLRDEVRSLRTACGQLTEQDPSPVHFRLANRYAHVLAAIAALGFWLNAGAGDETFGTGVAWLRLSLARVLTRLGRKPPKTPQATYDALYEELRSRWRRSVTLDLFATAIAQDHR